jgi:hypothetical protein
LENKIANKIESLLYSTLMLYLSDNNCLYKLHCESCRFMLYDMCLFTEIIQPFFKDLFVKRYSNDTSG